MTKLPNTIPEGSFFTITSGCEYEVGGVFKALAPIDASEIQQRYRNEYKSRWSSDFATVMIADLVKRGLVDLVDSFDLHIPNAQNIGGGFEVSEYGVAR